MPTTSRPPEGPSWGAKRITPSPLASSASAVRIQASRVRSLASVKRWSGWCESFNGLLCAGWLEPPTARPRRDRSRRSMRFPSCRATPSSQSLPCPDPPQSRSLAPGSPPPAGGGSHRSGRSGRLSGEPGGERQRVSYEVQAGGGSGPTVRRMLLGAQLRRLRGEAGLSREEAGAAIRASAWKIHRLENGQVSFKERDIVDLLGLYGVSGPGEVAGFVLMAREANGPGWWQHFGDLLPGWFRAFVDLESAASLIRPYEGQFVPGLLQTEAYCRAVVAGAVLTGRPEEVGRGGGWRRGREGLLGVGGPRLWAVVDEAALRRPV